MFEIRRVRNHDGGYHLVSDVLEYRECTNPPSPWKQVPVVSGYEAMVIDCAEGIRAIPHNAPPDVLADIERLKKPGLGRRD